MLALCSRTVLTAVWRFVVFFFVFVHFQGTTPSFRMSSSVLWAGVSLYTFPNEPLWAASASVLNDFEFLLKRMEVFRYTSNSFFPIKTACVPLPYFSLTRFFCCVTFIDFAIPLKETSNSWISFANEPLKIESSKSQSVCAPCQFLLLHS